MTTLPHATPPASFTAPERSAPTATCLNCDAPLVGSYCAACGQRAIDLTAHTWHVVKEGLADATDVDGRAVRTARALVSPGRLTIDFLGGRRTPYLGPVKLFLFAGTALTTTWIATRGIDAHFYGMRADTSAGSYIDAVVRGSLAAGFAIAGTGWVFDFGRRRLLDEAVFALHLVAALALFLAAVVWIGAGWKLLWGTAAAVPHSMPSLPLLLFLPGTVVDFAYVIAAVHRVYRGRWWATALRALTVIAVGIAAVTSSISRMH
jgi:hypothetical protein